VVTKKLAPPKGKKKATRRKKTRKWKVSPWLVAGGLLLLAAGLLYPYIREGRFASTGARIPEGARQFCVDLSHHNDRIVWDSLKVVVDRSGHTTRDLLRARSVHPVSTVILKATEGEKMLDKRFAEYWQEAGQRDFTRGAYHFFRSSKDPAKQAAWFIATVKLRHSDLPPILDLETMHAGCTREDLNKNALVWLKAVEKHYGRKPIIYTSDSFARDILSPDITGNYPMWIARYNRKQPRFQDWTMWQFTDQAIVYGANGGYVDLSVIK
jgi:lysozyme